VSAPPTNPVGTPVTVTGKVTSLVPFPRARPFAQNGRPVDDVGGSQEAKVQRTGRFAARGNALGEVRRGHYRRKAEGVAALQDHADGPVDPVSCLLELGGVTSRASASSSSAGRGGRRGPR
jgi:hypothetical protein